MNAIIQENLMHVSSQLESNLQLSSRLADLILASPVIQEYLPVYQNKSVSRAERVSYQNMIYSTLSNLLFSNYARFISSISIVQEDLETIHVWFSSVYGDLSDQLKQNLYGCAREAHGASVWVTDYCETSGLFLVRELREARELSFRSLGVLILQIHPKSLMQKSIQQSSQLASSYMLHNGENLIFSSDEDLKDSWREIAADSVESGEYRSRSDGRLFLYRTTLPDLGWEHLCLVPYESLHPTASLQTGLLVLFMVIGLVILGLVSALLRSLFQPLESLSYQMTLFSDGNFSRLKEDPGMLRSSDEIGQLYRAFNSMADRITYLVKENYEKELLNRDVRLKELESQLSPHFLYNTLDTINWHARMAGQEEISRMASSLAKILRASLSRSDTPYILEQELALTNSYMDIQLFRHRSSLRYSTSIPDELLDCVIPRFTIQPLVENAVKYGLQALVDDACLIQVFAETEKDVLRIHVRNNGSQFPDDILKDPACGSASHQGTGLAISNIHRRIQITCGEEYGITLHNEENLKTGELFVEACVCLPVNHLSGSTDTTQEDEHVQASDR